MAITVTDRAPVPGAEEILTDAALAFVEELHERFAARVPELLARRGERRAEIARTGRMGDGKVFFVPTVPDAEKPIEF